MPIFEFVCKSCNSCFETLVRASTRVECPSCKVTNLEKQLSVFAAGVKDQGAAAGYMPATACGMCGDPRRPGACSID